MSKFGFRIRTRSGTPVENLVVHASDQAEAERKISRMYQNCEILEARLIHTAIGDDFANLESIISQIAREPDDDQQT